MLFSIVTPSFRSSAWLKLCIASVADQDVPAEHIVQDSVSDDGTLDWLPKDSRVKAFIEKDKGMYDALNRGFGHAEGKFLAWLNCDEQYLPGALKIVAECFQKHPEVDVLFGDVVMVNSGGQYVSHRKMLAPLKYHTWTCHLSTLSCATFFRRGVMFDHGEFFDAKLRDVGDGEWMVRLLRRGVKMATLGQFTSTFTQTGANMSAGENAQRENRELRESAPKLAQKLRPLIILQHRLRRLLGGMYSQKPFNYEIYTQASPQRRTRFEAKRPVFHRG
jgi:glycosyltransferase involved in cell wall biosynthesis